MIPRIHTPLGTITTFNICVVIGILAMFFAIHIALRKAQNRNNEESFIFPTVICSGIAGYLLSAVGNVFANFLIFRKIQFSGVSLYDGLIGAIIILLIILNLKAENTEYNRKEWFDILTPGLVLFHFFGRLGCFFGGCCYGIPTESCFGVFFPDNLQAGIIHNGIKVFPTQLFEAILVLIIFILLAFVKNKFHLYMLCYAICRFFIEFIRAENIEKLFLSKAQTISLIIVITIFFFEIKKRKGVPL